MKHNGKSMVSTGIKSSELSIKHFLKPNQNDLADLVKIHLPLD